MVLLPAPLGPQEVRVRVGDEFVAVPPESQLDQQVRAYSRGLAGGDGNAQCHILISTKASSRSSRSQICNSSANLRWRSAFCA